MDTLGITTIACGLAGVLLATALYWLLPRGLRAGLMAALSIAFTLGLGIPDGIYILFNVALGYGVSRTLVARPKDRRQIVIRLALIWIIGTFAFFKIGPVLPSIIARHLPFDTAAILLPLGLSYVLFRIMHVVIEAYRGKLTPDSPATFVAYTLFFPTFLAGPLERYPRFLQQTRAIDRFHWQFVTQGVARLLLGAFKKAVVATTLVPLVMGPLRTPETLDPLRFLVSIWGLLVYIYMDFSGYTDMALGISRLFGYQVIENFNYPLIRTSIADFWRNWHMSLYSFIRDYFFYPVFGRSISPVKISIGLVSTMVVFMLWHFVSFSWFLLGIYHGMGLVVWNQFQEYKRKRPTLRKTLQLPAVRVLCWAATFTFVAFGQLFFFFPIDQVFAVLKAVVT